ncbi:MAG: hypothetical protein ABIN80_22460 [Dyadobacter sp.]|uniref:hypothetical protein n=1 Tax=Dyadobacter sp. TaxID=1914288 RepID=UPI003265174C
MIRDEAQINSEIDYAVNCIEAVRKTIGPDSDLLTPSEKFVDGYIHVPSTPGHGHELNTELIRKYAV